MSGDKITEHQVRAATRRAAEAIGEPAAGLARLDTTVRKPGADDRPQDRLAAAIVGLARAIVRSEGKVAEETDEGARQVLLGLADFLDREEEAEQGDEEA
jgi:hypothetical protein